MVFINLVFDTLRYHTLNYSTFSNQYIYLLINQFSILIGQLTMNGFDWFEPLSTAFYRLISTIFQPRLIQKRWFKKRFLKL